MTGVGRLVNGAFINRVGPHRVIANERPALGGRGAVAPSALPAIASHGRRPSVGMVEVSLRSSVFWRRMTTVIPGLEKRLSKQLMQAAERGDVDAIRRLLECGAALNCVNKKSETPLIVACRHNRGRGAMALLREPNLDVNHANRYRNTALFWAALYGDRTVAAELLKRPGIHLDHVNEFGETALMWAVKSGRTSVVQLLLQHGATADLADARNHSPLAVAVTREHHDIAQLLNDHLLQLRNQYLAQVPPSLLVQCQQRLQHLTSTQLQELTRYSAMAVRTLKMTPEVVYAQPMTQSRYNALLRERVAVEAATHCGALMAGRNAPDLVMARIVAFVGSDAPGLFASLNKKALAAAVLVSESSESQEG